MAPQVIIEDMGKLPIMGKEDRTISEPLKLNKVR